MNIIEFYKTVAESRERVEQGDYCKEDEALLFASDYVKELLVTACKPQPHNFLFGAVITGVGFVIGFHVGVFIN